MESDPGCCAGSQRTVRVLGRMQVVNTFLQLEAIMTASLESRNRCDGRLVVLTNIPTPYRTQFFNRLRKALDKEHIEFIVLFCAQSEHNRHWAFIPDDLEFEHRILKGIHPRIGGVTFHVNPAVGSWLRRWRPTWLLSAGAWLMPTGILALAALWDQQCVRLFWSEGHQDAVIHPKGLVARLRRRVLRSYDGFAVPNKKSAEYLARELGTQPLTILLPNTVDDTYFVPPSEQKRAEAREEHGFAVNDIVFVQVAQLEDRKGVKELVAGWTQAALHHPRLRLVLVGAGRLEDELRTTTAEAICNHRLVLTGAVSRDSVRHWLYAADGFVLATKRDPNPLSAIEAALTGLPILLSKKAGNFDELCEDGATGMALCEITPSAIGEVLTRFAALPQADRQAMGCRSSNNARKRFATDAAIIQFVDTLIHFPKSRGRQ